MFFDQITLGSRFKFFSNGELDDFSDRLSYKFSSFILYAIGGIILFKQYFSNTISCYFATDPGGSHLIEYIESYCLVNGIIPFTFNGTMPNNQKSWKEAEKFKIGNFNLKCHYKIFINLFQLFIIILKRQILDRMPFICLEPSCKNAYKTKLLIKI